MLLLVLVILILFLLVLLLLLVLATSLAPRKMSTNKTPRCVAKPPRCSSQVPQSQGNRQKEVSQHYRQKSDKAKNEKTVAGVLPQRF